MERLRKAIGGWLGWLGVGTGAISVISLVVRAFRVGVRPVLGEFLEFYRGLLRPVRELLQRIDLPFAITLPMLECAALYFVLLGLSVRAEFATSRQVLDIAHGRDKRSREERRAGRIRWQKAIRCVLLVPALTFQPLRDIGDWERHVVSRKPYQILESMSDYWDEQTKKQNAAIRRTMELTLWMFLAFPAAVVLFFALNAYGPF